MLTHKFWLDLLPLNRDVKRVEKSRDHGSMIYDR